MTAKRNYQKEFPGAKAIHLGPVGALFAVTATYISNKWCGNPSQGIAPDPDWPMKGLIIGRGRYGTVGPHRVMKPAWAVYEKEIKKVYEEEMEKGKLDVAKRKRGNPRVIAEQAERIRQLKNLLRFSVDFAQSGHHVEVREDANGALLVGIDLPDEPWTGPGYPTQG
jgi:hypothetical protein